MGRLTQSHSHLILGDISGCFPSILMLCHCESDISLKVHVPCGREEGGRQLAEKSRRCVDGVPEQGGDRRKVMLHQKFMTFDSHGNGHPIFLTGD